MNPKNIVRLEKCFWLSLYFIAFFFPFSNTGAKIFIVTALIAWIILKRYKNIRNEHFAYLLIFSGYYFINYIGLIHSDNLSTALTRLETRLSYLIFPLLIFTTPYQPKHCINIFWCFTISVICVSVACIVVGLMHVWPVTSTNLEKLTYIHLTDPLELHTTYLSICVCIAIFFLLYNFRSALPVMKKVLYGAIIAYLTAFLFLLLSRGVIIPFIIAITFSGLLYLFKKKSKKLILALCCLIFVTACSILFIDVMRERFVAPFVNSNTSVTNNNQTESVALHLKSWYCACQLLSDSHFFTGYGSGDEKDVLAGCYASHGWDMMVADRFNAHNEYLSCLLRNGIIEMLLLFVSLGTSLYWSIRTHNLLYVSFSIVFILSLLFTTLNDFSAIVALTFFNALLFIMTRANAHLQSNTLK